MQHYIYIVIHRQICFILSELISVARQARLPKLESKPGWHKRQTKILPLSHEEANASKVNLNKLWITIVIVSMYQLNGYRKLDSYQEPCIYTNGNTITSFARELSPTGVGSLYIYIYIYICLFKNKNFSN